MVLGKGNRRLPPYVSYRTFSNFLEQLEQHGTPARIDRSFWGDRFSGSTGTQLIAALRFLNLTDDAGAPTARLKQLVGAHGGQRAEVVKAVTQESYAFILQGSIDPQNATYSQFEEVLHANYELANDVARKCIKFFIELSEEAEIPLSPFITKKGKRVRSTAGTKKISRKAANRTNQNLVIPQHIEEVPKQAASWGQILLVKFPTFDPTWPNEVKLKWFEGFEELLRIGTVQGNGKGSLP